MSKSGTVTRGEHTATFEERDGKVLVTSVFGSLQIEAGSAPAKALAMTLLGLQMGWAARRSGHLDKSEAAQVLQAEWAEKWGSTFQARWIDRPPPVEVINAVEDGWLPKTGRMIDLGCGTAEIAAWFAERGYQATGVDIAQAAVDRAAAKHSNLKGSLELFAADLCAQTLPAQAYDILVDRGCLHQIPPNLVPDYVRTIASAAVPGAKLMLFMKAFRSRGIEFGNAEVIERMTDRIRRTFAGEFDLERAVPTYLNPDNPEDPQPGMAFWLNKAE